MEAALQGTLGVQALTPQAERLQAFLTADPEAISIITAAVQAQQERGAFCWSDVYAHPSLLRRMSKEGLIDLIETVDGTAFYGFADIEAAFEAAKAADAEAPEPGLFEEIVGYDDIKQLTRRALESPKPVSILYLGSPASAKTLFLEGIARLPGSRFMLGGSTKKAGLTRFLMENGETVKRIVLDELDKASRDELSALLSLMESGIVTEMKTGRTGFRRLNVQVYAAANRAGDLPPELMSRFAVLRFDPYSETEFTEVCRRMLMVREGKTANLATYIATRCWDSGLRSPRDTVRVARLSETAEDVDWALTTLKGS